MTCRVLRKQELIKTLRYQRSNGIQDKKEKSGYTLSFFTFEGLQLSSSP